MQRDTFEIENFPDLSSFIESSSTSHLSIVSALQTKTIAIIESDKLRALIRKIILATNYTIVAVICLALVTQIQIPIIQYR